MRAEKPRVSIIIFSEFIVDTILELLTGGFWLFILYNCVMEIAQGGKQEV